MSRKFGDYVHLHWQNYYDHGTYRNSEKKNNYNANLFDAHYNQIIAAVKSSSIAPEKRESIAKAYNQQNQKAWQLFKRMASDKIGYYNALKVLLKTINSQWDDGLIDEIIAGLSWDDSLQTFKYTPQKDLEYRTKKGTLQGWPALGLSSNAQFHYFNTVEERIKVASDYLSKISMQSGDEAAKDLKRLQSMSKTIQEEKIALQNLNLTEQQLWQLTKNSKANQQQSSFMNRVLRKLLNKYVEELNAMRSKYISVATVNTQIQAALAEIFGNIVATDGTQLAEDAVIEVIKKALQTGRTSAPVTSTSGNMISLNVSAVLQEIAKNPKTANILNKSGQSQDGSLRYSFSDLGQTRAQKRDVTLTVNAEDYGISVKNTDITNAFLSYDNKKGYKQTLPTISLQSSSLLLFLQGIDQSSGFGTHYLNALSKHPDVSGMATMQASALNSLKLYILYSTLTGKGQLRTGGFARILAIYDKAQNSPSRIKLYDMSDIILKIAEKKFTQGVKFSPAINESFLLKNEKVDYDGDWYASSGVRVTNVLMEARQKNVSVSLYTAWLRDAMKTF